MLRFDTWVLIVSIAIPLACVVALFVLHVLSRLAETRRKRPTRHALEPRPSNLITDRLKSEPTGKDAKPISSQILDDPEHLEGACAALAETLAKKYLELAESYAGRGKAQKATFYFEKVVQGFPGTPQADLAKERLSQLTFHS
jgi:hypothetical protein